MPDTISTANIISIGVSALALFVSALTAWLTLLRKGRILIIQPTVIYFGPDNNPKSQDKVFLRTLLCVTGKRGHMIENMFARLRRGETQQNFNIWIYGDADLRRGSGLFIPDTGLATDHYISYFRRMAFPFSFYRAIMMLKSLLLNLATMLNCFTQSVILKITPDLYKNFKQPGYGLYFDWGPDAGRYFAHVRPPPRTEIPRFLQDMLTDKGNAAAHSEC